jgi:hypothetical protein
MWRKSPSRWEPAKDWSDLGHQPATRDGVSHEIAWDGHSGPSEDVANVTGARARSDEKGAMQSFDLAAHSWREGAMRGSPNQQESAK